MEVKGFGMLLTDPDQSSQLRVLEDRCVEGIGFANRPGGKYRPDAASWAVLALRAAGSTSAVIEKARRSLVQAQGADGRVCIAPQLTDASWPTALAILAWHGAPDFEVPRRKALQFLLRFQQPETSRTPETSEGHDETIPGWPWVAKTHAWAEPTAYALMALRVCGCAAHQRTQDAVRLLLDRQLAAGGWNCGNTVTFGLQMRPTPENTGMTLAALAGMVPRDAVDKSIIYLHSQLASLNAPMSLAWAILGLHAWLENPEQPHERILGLLARQDEYGPYDTTSLSLLLLAWHCAAGLVCFLERAASRDEK
jgi:hypothetical protein